MSERSYWTSLAQRRLSRRRMLVAGSAAGAGFAALALAACGSTPTTKSSGSAPAPSASSAAAGGTPKPGGTLTVFLPSNYPLDPQKVSASAQRVPGPAMSRVFMFKTSTDPTTINDHATVPDLGLSAESPDAITWTVKLRPDAKFQNIAPVNGHAVEAEDIKATFERALDPATASPNRGQLGMMDAGQITTPDKQTVVFKLNYPYAPFRSILASPAYSWIFPREVLSGGYDPSKQVIGSGPFLLDKIEPDVAYTYKKNPDWHFKPQPYVETLKVAIIPDVSAQKAQFLGGNLDELNPVPNVFDLPTIQRQAPKATIFKIPSANAFPLYFQMGDPASPFKDIRVRQAVSMLIDRDALNKAVYDGQGASVVYVPAYMGRWSLPVEKLDADLQQYYKFNPAEAKKLLQAAGRSDLSIRLVNPFASSSTGGPGSTTAKSVEVINQSFNSNGLKSQIVNGDYNKDFVDAGKGWRQGYFDDDMVLYASQSPYTEADDWLFSYFHSKSTSNQEHLNDPTYDAMVDKERTIVNDDDRVKAVDDIQKYLAKQLYATMRLCTGSTAHRPKARRWQQYDRDRSRACGGATTNGTPSSPARSGHSAVATSAAATTAA
jgi:peptide/nickel transport system substrate-binding protein